MLSKSETLEVGQTILLCRAVNCCVLQNVGTRSSEAGTRRLDPHSAVSIARTDGGIFQTPNFSMRVELEFGEVVPLVEKLKNAGEDLRHFFRKVELSVAGVVVFGAECRLEEGRVVEDVFVGSKEPWWRASDGYGYHSRL